MIAVWAKDINSAWEQLMKKMMAEGRSSDDALYYKTERVIAEIENPALAPIHPLFPDTQERIDITNRYMATGADEENVWHEWTKIYYHRLNDEPNSQIKYIADKLRQKPGGKAVACTWRKEIDQTAEIMPCMLVVWCQKRQGKLEMHLHGQEGDIYKKSIMNMQEYVAIQHRLAEELGLEVGRFIFSIDCAMIFAEDREAVEKVVAQLG